MLPRQPLGVELHVSPMKFFNHTFEDKLGISQNLTYQIHEVINASKADEQIFRSIVDSLLTDDLADTSDLLLTVP